MDTHVFRVTKRLGWIPANATAEKAHLLLAKLYYGLHLNLIEYGRAICHARQPRCEVCPLTDLCAFWRQTER